MAGDDFMAQTTTPPLFCRFGAVFLGMIGFRFRINLRFRMNLGLKSHMIPRVVGATPAATKKGNIYTENEPW